MGGNEITVNDKQVIGSQVWMLSDDKLGDCPGTLGVTSSNNEIVGDNNWHINEELDGVRYFLPPPVVCTRHKLYVLIYGLSHKSQVQITHLVHNCMY